MATNHTQNYQLNLWAPTDTFSREEFNENSEKIDAAIKARMPVTGSYSAKSDAEVQVTLGFYPKLLILMAKGSSGSPYYAVGIVIGGTGMTILPGGLSSPQVTVNSTGFRVAKGDYQFNSPGYSSSVRYVALA